MATMNMKQKSIKKKVSENEIDEIVVEQAENDLAWETPIQVRKKKSAFFSIPPHLASRVAFLARLHRETDVEEWFIRIIQERIRLES
jgi:hypothetical protein